MDATQKIELNKLLKYIEENIRSSDTTQAKYIDPYGNLERLNAKQNQVIYGRRGSGKSLLITALKENTRSEALFTKINVEDFKDVSFPDSLLLALQSFIKQLDKQIHDSYNFYEFKKWFYASRIRNKLKKKLDNISSKLQEPDKYDQNITDTNSEKTKSEFGAKTTVGNIQTGIEDTTENKISKIFPVEKLDALKKEITELKEIICEISAYMNRKHIFLVLDDFYFIKKADQPYFVDYFHRLSKDTPLFIKVATIKHRSSLYVNTDTYIGMEMRHDAQSIELDYTLDKYDVLEGFMKQIIKQIQEDSKANLVVENLLSANAFKYLCIASGGVVRDFLSLFIQIGEELKKENDNQRISKPEVIEIAILNIQNKLEALKTDSVEEKEPLEQYLTYIKDYMISEVKTNIFLIGLTDLNRYPQINQAIKELVDFRLIHQIEQNISAKYDVNQRYSAYMIDVGFFPGSRNRTFVIIEPGILDVHGRNDDIRSAPKMELEKLDLYMKPLVAISEIVPQV